jgi:hypothetical protein
MHCLDCHSRGEQVLATGICRQCGAAVCPAHTTVSDQALTCTQPVYPTVTVKPPARQLLCTTCAQAHRAYAACCPQSAYRAGTP